MKACTRSLLFVLVRVNIESNRISVYMFALGTEMHGKAMHLLNDSIWSNELTTEINE